MRRAATLLCLAGAAACGSRDGDPAVAARPSDPPPAKETRVFEVKSSDDLVRLRSEYMNLWESGFDGLLEVHVAPAAYTAAGWDLWPASDSKRLGAPPTIDVVLRGESSAPPVPQRVQARSLRLEGLILELEYGSTELQVRDSFTMQGCLLVDGRGMEHGRPLVAVLGLGDRGSDKTRPVAVTIERSWFVRNFQGRHPGPMIKLGSVPAAPTYFDRVAIADSAFLGNAFAAELDIEFAREVRVDRSIFFKTWPDGVLISSTSSGDIALEDSVVVVEQAGHVARHGDESPAIQLAASSRLYLRGGGAPPASLRADPSQVVDSASIPAAIDALTEAARMPASIIPGPDLKQELDAALR